MTTLIARLSGPLQSWGGEAKFTRRGTGPSPTYSGLLGLARAALGYDRAGRDARTGELVDDGWLRQLTMALRIDHPGSTLVDYHTVNPPAVHRYRHLSNADRGQLATVPTGEGKPWRIGGEQQTLQTWRTYLTGAAFTWLVNGDDAAVRRLAAALDEPHWQLSLGRKACVPDHPLYLGCTEDDLMAAADTVPTVAPATKATAPARPPGSGTSDAPPSVPLQILTGPVPQGAQRLPALAEVPLGAHPNNGYGYLTRHQTHVTPPTTDRAGLQAWAEENLTR